MKYKENGQFKPIYVKALDSMPVGTEVDFDGQVADIPTGWEQVEGNNIIVRTLWTNTNPNQAFEPQTITLNSGDYDYLIWFYKLAWTSNIITGSVICSKGDNIQLQSVNAYESNGMNLMKRLATYVDNTHYSIEDGIIADLTNHRNTNGKEYNIPLKVVGIKEV